MSNGWTGAQYSIVRAALGIYLAVHFAQLLPWAAEVFSSRGVLPDGRASPLLRLFPNVLAVADSPAAVTALITVAIALSALFAVGFHDRLAGIGVWYALACLFGRNPLIANPSLPFVGWILLAHACLPRSPYGSWTARGALDPRGAWRMPPAVFAAAWTLMALGYSYSGYTKLVSPSWVDGTALARILDNPLARPGRLRLALLGLPPSLLQLATWGGLALELGFAPLALVRRLRPWLWAAMLAMHLGLLVLIDFADLSLGMMLLHAFTFDPAWLRPHPAPSATVFYDGHCGLCHRLVRFVVAEDTAGSFRFAPLDSAAFRTTVPAWQAPMLADTVVVRTHDGALLVRSRAVRYIFGRLGGLWRVLAWLTALVPAAVADRVYDAIARLRHRMFSRPPEACPRLPPDLRSRFDV